MPVLATFLPDSRGETQGSAKRRPTPPWAHNPQMPVHLPVPVAFLPGSASRATSPAASLPVPGTLAPPWEAMSLLMLPNLILATAALSTAHATEVVWDGHYRARGEFFDSLSLSDTNSNAEGAAWTMNHRLRLRPGFRISDQVSLFTQVDVLPYVSWGSSPVAVVDPLTGEVQSVVFSDAVAPPTTEEGAATLQNIQMTRLWGEVQTPYGLLRFGRVPNHWGSGMVFNAGNRPVDEYGDTVDRLQFTGQAGQVFLMGGYENRYEGLAAEKDDYRAIVASVLFESEKAALGTFHTYRWQNTGDTRYGVWIGDLWGRATLGMAEAETEFAAIVGGGDLTNGINDVRTTAFGGHIRVGIDPGNIRAGVLTGFATGDADPNDTSNRTFSFDPDFNISVFMFEEAMPTLKPPANTLDADGRTTAAAQTGTQISDALFFQPRVGWRFNDKLTTDLTWLAARRAKQAEVPTTEPGYGSEFNGTVRWDPYPHFWVQATGAVFLPGKVFSQYESVDYGTGFSSPAIGGRLLTTIEF